MGFTHVSVDSRVMILLSFHLRARIPSSLVPRETAFFSSSLMDLSGGFPILFCRYTVRVPAVLVLEVAHQVHAGKGVVCKRGDMILTRMETI